MLLRQVTGIDVVLRQSDDDEEEVDSEDGSANGNGNGGVEEYVKKRWNLNASFRDDRSADRLGPESFDLINSRLLAEGINADRWSSYVRELKLLLRPGGWLQMVEIQLPFQSSSGRLNDDSCLTRWWQWYSWALQRMGKNVRIGRELQRLLATEGFTNVTARSIDLPIGDWNSGGSQ